MDNREALTKNRASCRKLTRERYSSFEQKWMEHAALKHARRIQGDSAVPTCSVCGRFLLSKAGMINHFKSHGQKHNEAVYEEALPALPKKHTCPTCGLVCKSADSLTGHSKMYKDFPQQVISTHRKFKCHICERTCKTITGLKNRLRAHGFAVIK